VLNKINIKQKKIMNENIQKRGKWGLWVAIAVIAAIILGIWIYNASAQTQDQEMMAGRQPLTKDKVTQFYSDMYDVMERNDMNPGYMLRGEEIDKEEFLQFVDEMFGLAERHGMMGMHGKWMDCYENMEK